MRSQLAVVTPRRVAQIYSGFEPYAIALDDSSKLFLIGPDFDILPGAWHTVSTQLSIDPAIAVGEKMSGCAVRVLTESGLLEFAFTIRGVAGK